MARRRSRVKKSPSTEITSATAAMASSSTARTLLTLPSAVSTLRLARSPSKITELLDHAHHHVELAMRVCDTDDADGSALIGDDDWPTVTSTMRTQTLGGSLSEEGTVAKKATVLIRVLLRKKHRVTRLVAKPLDDARYNRLKQGYETITQHLQATHDTRKGLEDALAAFRNHAAAMESMIPPEPRDSRNMMTSLHACFAQSANLVDELLSTLAQDVAEQTQTKVDQLVAFKGMLERRERLVVETTIAKQQLNQFHKLKAKQRSAIPGAYDLELAQLKHEYSALRRRLMSMTAAMEHVFQFHARLDECIVDPEMAVIHEKLAHFFEKHAREFEKNVK